MTGDILRKRREELGLDIDQISDLLKIKPDYLRWIESDSFEKLPAPVYTMGYIRCYARHLELDADPIIQYYTEHLSQPKTTTIMPVGFSRKRSPIIYYIFFVIITVSIVFFLRLNIPRRQTDNIQTPANKVSVEQPPVAAQPPAADQNIPGGNLSTLEKKEYSLNITASEKTWIMIKFSNGKIEELTLQPGGVINWKFQDKALVKIGNAGGIKLNLNGKDIGSPGTKGQVITLSIPDN